MFLPVNIITQPMSRQDVAPGTNVMFAVVANGSNSTYQWQRNGEDLTDNTKYSGTMTANLTVMNVMEEDEGNFTCVVTDDVDNVTSSAAELTVRKCVYVCVHSHLFVASFLGLPTRAETNSTIFKCLVVTYLFECHAVCQSYSRTQNPTYRLIALGSSVPLECFCWFCDMFYSSLSKMLVPILCP